MANYPSWQRTEEGFRKGLSRTTTLVSKYAIPVTLVLIAFPFVWLIFYATPAADDFCKASLSYYGQTQSDLLTFVRLYYGGWSARWLTNLTQGFLKRGPNLLGHYPYLLLAVIVSQILALQYFFATVLRLGYRDALFVASLFYIVWATSLGEPCRKHLLAYGRNGIWPFAGIDVGRGRLALIITTESVERFRSCFFVLFDSSPA